MKYGMVNTVKVIDPFGDQNHNFVLKIVKTDAMSQNVDSEWIEREEERGVSANRR